MQTAYLDEMVVVVVVKCDEFFRKLEELFREKVKQKYSCTVVEVANKGC